MHPVPQAEQPDSVPTEETSAAADVRRLVALGRASEAEALLRDALSHGGGDATELNLLLGEVLEGEDRPEEASVHYLTAAGRDGGSAEAWDGIARVRRRTGDDLGAVRAGLHAWELSGDRERRDRRTPLRRALERLSDRELGALASEIRGLDALDLARAERLRRRERQGDGAAFPVEVLAPFGGKLAHFGEAFLLGARVALDERDAGAAAEGGSPRRVVLEWRDTNGDLLRSAKAARSAILEDDAGAILGPLLSVTSIAAGAVAQSYGVPLLAPTATDPEIATIGPYVLTLDPSPGALARPLADFCVNVLGATRFGVLLPSDGLTAEYEREFRNAVVDAGGEVVVSVAFEPDETDFRRLIERIDRENVDAVYIPGSVADLEALASQLDFYDFHRRILGNGGWTHPKILDPGNLALEGAVLAVEATDNPDSDFQLRLRESVRTRRGQELSRFHIEGYRAMSSLLAALDRGAGTGEEIADMLRLRQYWPAPPDAERVQLLTYRDGVLGPAAWATGFDLVPKVAPPDPESETDGDGDPATEE